MPEIYPLQVDINQDNVDDLIKLFVNAYNEIVAEINGATDFGVANRRAILAQIEEILQRLAEKSNEYLAETLPQYYSVGADDAVRQLSNIDAELAVKTGFNKIHEEAIGSLVDGASTAIAESIQGVYRSTTQLLSKAVREQITQRIATGQISGASLTQVRKQIKGTLAEQGLTAIVDRSGRNWALKDYAEMVYRTKAVEARNRGLINRMAENDYDLVQVSDHFGSCDYCKPWQGKILSVSGITKGYETVADAERGGLFHPNCRHTINALVPSLARMTRAYDPNTKTLTMPGLNYRNAVSKELDNKVISAAVAYNDEFMNKVKELAAAGDWEYQFGPVKKLERSLDKVIYDYDGAIYELKDANRSVIFINNPNDKAEFDRMVEKTKSVFGNIERTKIGLDRTEGYRNNMINVIAPDGHIVEIQVTTKEMWRAKIDLGGDALYHKVREKVEGFEAYEQEMMNLYDAANKATMARLQ